VRWPILASAIARATGGIHDRRYRQHLAHHRRTATPFRRIAAGKYDWVNSGITAKRFPVEGIGTPCARSCAAFRARSAFTRPNFPGVALGVDLPMDPEVANVFETARACSPSQ